MNAITAGRFRSELLRLFHRSMILGCALLVATLATSAQAQKPVTTTRSCTTRVLFLGNSYTYFNDLPALLSELAKAGHQCTVETRMVAPGGKTLRDIGGGGGRIKGWARRAGDLVVFKTKGRWGLNLTLEGRSGEGGA